VQHPHIISIFDFRDPLIKRAIHAIKYYHRKDLVGPLAFELASELRALSGIETYTLVPVPMPRLRKLLRGYNQAERIAEELSRLLALPVDANVLVRTHASRRQAMVKTKAERLKNQAGSFSIEKSSAGMNLILVDDVTTTGATVEEARRILLRNGAKSVLAATLAH
jgi:ComF family protein